MFRLTKLKINTLHTILFRRLLSSTAIRHSKDIGIKRINSAYDGKIKKEDVYFTSSFLLYTETELLSYDLILESTLDVLVALYSCLINTKLLSSLSYSDVLLVNLDTCCYESLSELS